MNYRHLATDPGSDLLGRAAVSTGHHLASLHDALYIVETNGFPAALVSGT